MGCSYTRPNPFTINSIMAMASPGLEPWLLGCKRGFQHTVSRDNPLHYCNHNQQSSTIVLVIVSDIIIDHGHINCVRVG